MSYFSFYMSESVYFIFIFERFFFSPGYRILSSKSFQYFKSCSTVFLHAPFLRRNLLLPLLLYTCILCVLFLWLYLRFSFIADLISLIMIHLRIVFFMFHVLRMHCMSWMCVGLNSFHESWEILAKTLFICFFCPLFFLLLYFWLLEIFPQLASALFIYFFRFCASLSIVHQSSSSLDFSSMPYLLLIQYGFFFILDIRY